MGGIALGKTNCVTRFSLARKTCKTLLSLPPPSQPIQALLFLSTMIFLFLSLSFLYSSQQHRVQNPPQVGSWAYKNRRNLHKKKKRGVHTRKKRGVDTSSIFQFFENKKKKKKKKKNSQISQISQILHKFYTTLTDKHVITG